MMKAQSCSVPGLGGAVFLACWAAFAGAALAQQSPGYSYPPPYNPAPAYPQSGYGESPYQPPAGYSREPGYGYEQPAYPRGYGPADSYQAPQPRYVSPLKFLPTFGRKFGDMFRRIFYGDEVSTQPSMPGAGYGPQPRGSLDSAPPPYSSHYENRAPAPQPAYPQRYESPPAPEAPARSVPPSNRNSGPRSAASTPPAPPKKTGSSASASKRYTPPSVTRREAEPSPKKEQAPSYPKTRSGTQFAPDHYAAAPKQAPEKAAGGGGAASSNSNSGSGSGSFLKGKRTSKAGRVISPYPPYQELDITGLASGSLALDPTTQKVFEVP